MKNGKQKKYGTYKKLSTEKNQSSSKLPEMARKLVEMIFGLFSPHPQKQISDFLATLPPQKKLGYLKNVK